MSQDSLPARSLFDELADLAGRKKMPFFNPIPHVHYRLCSLTRGEQWYISFYVTNPENGKLKRIRIKVNRIKPLSRRRQVAREIMAAIDQRLVLGWNPLVEGKAPKAHTGIMDAMDSFLKVKARESEDNSMRSYRSFVKTFKKWLTENGISSAATVMSISRDVALCFLDEMEQTLSAKTYNNYVGFYRSMFNWMVKRGYTSANPFDGIEKKAKRLTKKKRRILTDTELAVLVEYLSKENQAFLAMCLICYCCFIRPKEIVLLRCRDIDLDRQVIHVDAKIAKNDNDSFRTIPDDLMPVLRHLDLSHPDWYVFGRNTWKSLGPGPFKLCSRRISTWWNTEVRPSCGFGMDVQFYSLKDTGITNMLGSGVPINLVQQQADHSSVAMTAIYVGKKAEAVGQLKGANIIAHGEEP